jgi:hypothetical protein
MNRGTFAQRRLQPPLTVPKHGSYAQARSGATRRSDQRVSCEPRGARQERPRTTAVRIRERG